MSSYDELVQCLPLPTQEQTRAFADYLVDARSWHTHLPLSRPGASFVFFLDAKAGTRHIMYPRTGEERHRVVTDTQAAQPHSRYTTKDYRARCGHWQYCIIENPKHSDQTLNAFTFDHAGERLEIDLVHPSMHSCELTAFIRSSPVLWTRLQNEGWPDLGWERSCSGALFTREAFLEAAHAEAETQHKRVVECLGDVRLSLAQIQTGGYCEGL